MSRRRIVTRRMQTKLLKAVPAKTPQGKANCPMDAFTEEGLHDPVLDLMLHGINEVVLADGPLDRKLQAYIRKLLRYRGLARTLGVEWEYPQLVRLSFSDRFSDLVQQFWSERSRGFRLGESGRYD